VNRVFIRVILCLVFAGANAAGAAAQSTAAAAVQQADAGIAPPPGAAARRADASSSSGCGAAQTTSLTPDSQSLTTSLSNANNQIKIAFSTGGVVYWTVMLSTSAVDVALSSNRGNAVVTFQKGLNAHLTANGSAGFNIFLSGNIVDDGTTYSLVGTYLGTFLC
jgi:hypothetical protein